MKTLNNPSVLIKFTFEMCENLSNYFLKCFLKNAETSLNFVFFHPSIESSQVSPHCAHTAPLTKNNVRKDNLSAFNFIVCNTGIIRVGIVVGEQGALINVMLSVSPLSSFRHHLHRHQRSPSHFLRSRRVLPIPAMTYSHNWTYFCQTGLCALTHKPWDP